MSKRTQILCVWSMPAYIVLMFLALGPLLPPPSPGASAEQVAAFYKTNARAILEGSVWLAAATAVMGATVGALTAQLKQIEGPLSPLTYTQLILGVCAVALTMPSAWFLAAAAFRPDRSPAEILLLNDAVWFCFLMSAPLGVIRTACIGFVIILDHRAKPIIPRWVGGAVIFSGLAVGLGSFTPLYKEGPLAWDGWAAWHLGANVYFVAWLILFFYMLKAAHKGGADDIAKPSAPPTPVVTAS